MFKTHVEPNFEFAVYGSKDAERNQDWLLAMAHADFRLSDQGLHEIFGSSSNASTLMLTRERPLRQPKVAVFAIGYLAAGQALFVPYVRDRSTRAGGHVEKFLATLTGYAAERQASVITLTQWNLSHFALGQAGFESVDGEPHVFRKPLC